MQEEVVDVPGRARIDRDGLPIRRIGTRADVIALERADQRQLARECMLPAQSGRGSDVRYVGDVVAARESRDGAVGSELRVRVAEVDPEGPLAAEQRLHLRLEA